MSECTHAIGMATIEYHESIIHVGADATVQSGFEAFNFCPYCGDDVTAEAEVNAAAVRASWDAFWAEYGVTHGEKEMKRAMKSSAIY